MTETLNTIEPIQYYPFELRDIVQTYGKDQFFEFLEQSNNCNSTELKFLYELLDKTEDISKIRLLVYYNCQFAQTYLSKLIPTLVQLSTDQMFLLRIYQLRKMDITMEDILDYELFFSDIFLADIGDIPIGYQIMELKVFYQQSIYFMYVLVHENIELHQISKSPYIMDIEDKIIHNTLPINKFIQYILPQTDTEFYALCHLMVNSYYTIQERLNQRSNVVKEQLNFLFNQVNQLSALESFSSVFESKKEVPKDGEKHAKN